MSHTSKVVHTWTCDGCGAQMDVVVADGMSKGKPSDWSQVVQGSLHAVLGNLSASQLCAVCTEAVRRVLEGDEADR